MSTALSERNARAGIGGAPRRIDWRRVVALRAEGLPWDQVALCVGSTSGSLRVLASKRRNVADPFTGPRPSIVAIPLWVPPALVATYAAHAAEHGEERAASIVRRLKHQTRAA